MTPEERLRAKQAAMSNEELIELCHKEVGELAKSYGRSHHMTIPPSIRDTDMLLSELISRFEKKTLLPTSITTIPYQCCPKCNGQGTVSKPPYIAGDVNEWSSSSISFVCDVCNGVKIIPQFVIQAEEDKWISAEKQLPPYDKYVLARHNMGNWIDSDDQENVNCVVVKLVKSEVKDNNLKPYKWVCFPRPSYFFGQEITHWTEIPAKSFSNELG